MNKVRRKQIEDVLNTLAGAWQALEDIKAEEEEAQSNMPDSLQETDQATNAAECVEALDGATSDLDTLIDALRNSAVFER